MDAILPTIRGSTYLLRICSQSLELKGWQVSLIGWWELKIVHNFSHIRDNNRLLRQWVLVRQTQTNLCHLIGRCLLTKRILKFKAYRKIIWWQGLEYLERRRRLTKAKNKWWCKEDLPGCLLALQGLRFSATQTKGAVATETGSWKSRIRVSMAWALIKFYNLTRSCIRV